MIYLIFYKATIYYLNPRYEDPFSYMEIRLIRNEWF